MFLILFIHVLCLFVYFVPFLYKGRVVAVARAHVSGADEVLVLAIRRCVHPILR